MSSNVESEIAWRFDAWNQLQKSPNWPILTAAEVQDLGLYRGGSGVWVDKVRTSDLIEHGVAVGLLHTGKHYDDDVDETGILYHYPTTDRPPSRDANEIQAMKNAKLLGIPIFVIENFHGGKRVNLAWMNDFDDKLRICVLTFHGVLPENNKFYLPDGSTGEVKLFGQKRTKKVEIEKAERDPLFKFNILKKFQGKCLITGLDVTEMLDAAHIIPVANGGTEHPENGLLLSASVHRALDAGLWAINPETLNLETRSSGPDARQMKFDVTDLKAFSKLLNSTALLFRYENLYLKGKRG
jgi:hypothetical protein